jgi:DNA-binding response OmpR family regulator
MDSPGGGIASEGSSFCDSVNNRADPVKSILILDDDLGFVFWLGQTLDAAGYDSLPAKGVPEAIELLAQFRLRIDVLIARCTLPHVAEFANALRSFEGEHLSTIALLDRDDEECEKVFLASIHAVLAYRSAATT